MEVIVGQNKVLITILVENELFPDLLSLGFFYKNYSSFWTDWSIFIKKAYTGMLLKYFIKEHQQWL